MIKINFDPETFLATAEPDVKLQWETLIKAADEAKERVIREWEEYENKLRVWNSIPESKRGTKPEFKATFDETIWKGFRNWFLINVFNGKCAYCETQTVGYIPDSEHFRPKGRVRNLEPPDNEPGDPVTMLDQFGNTVQHPGYFWLAYYWKNLLPSCQTCNRYHGKKDLFPVGKAHVCITCLSAEEIEKLKHTRVECKNPKIFVVDPEDLDDMEESHLINPLFENPRDHLVFDISGTVLVKEGSKKGEKSIKAFDLNDPDKKSARSERQEDARKLFLSKLMAADASKMRQVGEAFLMSSYFCGRKPYAAAVYDYIVAVIGGLENQIAPRIENCRKSRFRRET